MSNTLGIKRLTKEYINLQKEPIEQICSKPLENNLFEWHYVLKPSVFPYTNGEYHGKLVFPDEYPLKPPSIYMFTPSGRFEINQRLCLSMSDFHPENWNPSWTVSTILLGIIRFMVSNESTLGSIDKSSIERVELANSSHHFNLKNEIFVNLFISNNNEVDSIDSLMEDVNNSKKCRFCYQNDHYENVVAPCQCAGDNKWVHPSCLQKWQKTTILSQTTHPKYQNDIDRVCNVCFSEYQITFTDRHKLMLGFTGSEIANMIKIGSIAVSQEESSEFNKYLINSHNDNLKLIDNLTHWTYSVFLIANINYVKSNKNSDQVSNPDPNDKILALNLSRPVNQIPETIYTLDGRVLQLRQIWSHKYDFLEYSDYLDVNYFIGGPCNPDECHAIAMIPGEISKLKINPNFFTIIQTLTTELDDLIHMIYGSGEMIAKLAEDYYRQIDSSQKIKIYAFSGFAEWDRTQFLGEISKGNWGLCHSHENDLLTIKYQIWSDIYNSGRLLFPVKNEYSEDFNTQKAFLSK